MLSLAYRGWRVPLQWFELDTTPFNAAVGVWTMGLCTLVLTPIVAAIMDYALSVLGHAVPEEKS